MSRLFAFFVTTQIPEILPIFPVEGALLLPGGELPLNIFEDRYIAMVDYALGTKGRMIGMIQPRDGGHELYDVGCAGRIASFHETDEGHYMITLVGVSRFRVAREAPQRDGYRVVVPDFGPYMHDTEKRPTLGIDRTRLVSLLKQYFQTEGMTCEWDNLKNADDDTLMTALAMVCPFGPAEKQAMIEAACAQTRGEIFIALLEQAIMNGAHYEGGCCN